MATVAGAVMLLLMTAPFTVGANEPKVFVSKGLQLTHVSSYVATGVLQIKLRTKLPVVGMEFSAIADEEHCRNNTGLT